MASKIVIKNTETTISGWTMVPGSFIKKQKQRQKLDTIRNKNTKFNIRIQHKDSA